MAQTGLPTSDIAAGAWVGSAGGNLWSNIDEAVASDADYIQSSLSPGTVDVAEVKLTSLTTPGSNTADVIKYRFGKSASGGDSLRLVVRLMQGATEIASWVHSDIDTLITAVQTLGPNQANLITDWTNLRIRFETVVGPYAAATFPGTVSVLDAFSGGSGGSQGQSTTAGASTGGASADYPFGNVLALASPSTITSISMYIANPTANTQNLRAFIMGTSGGVPSGDALATTPAVTIAASQAAGWVTFTFSSPVSVAAGSYMIGVWAGGGGVVNLYWQATAGKTAYWNYELYSATANLVAPSPGAGGSTVWNTTANQEWLMQVNFSSAALSSSWSALPGRSIGVLTGAASAKGGTAPSAMQWVQRTDGDCMLKGKVAVLPSSGQTMSMWWHVKSVDRLSAPSTDFSGYELRVSQAGNVGIYAYNGTTSTLVGGVFTTTVSLNDTFGIQQIGRGIQVFKNDVLLYSVTDSTYYDGGRYGLSWSDTTGAWTNFTAGVPSPFITVVTGNWKWPVSAARQSTSQAPATYAKSTVPGSGAIFGAAVAIVTPAAGTPTTAVTDPFGPTKNVQIPAGAKAGPTTDGTLGVIQTDGQHFGFWGFKNANPGSPSGIGRVAPGGVNEDKPSSGSNAAWLDVTQGIITVADLASGIPHALMFSLPTSAVNGVPPKWPSVASFNDSRCVYGQWLCLDPNGVVPNYGGDVLMAYIDKCMRTYGAFNRDQTPAGFSIYGQDYINQNSNPPSVWAGAGVVMTLASGMAYNWARYLTSSGGVQIPWNQLIALDPPGP